MFLRRMKEKRNAEKVKMKITVNSSFPKGFQPVMNFCVAVTFSVQHCVGSNNKLFFFFMVCLFHHSLSVTVTQRDVPLQVILNENGVISGGYATQLMKQDAVRTKVM